MEGKPVNPDKQVMYERFTDRARKVMQLANEEAQRLNREYIGTEHVLLGLVKEGSGVAANALNNLDLDLRTIRREVEKLVQPRPKLDMPGKRPQTPRAKKVIEYAIEEARSLNRNYVGTEHLLLGLLREQEGVAAQILMNLGLRLEDVRDEVLKLLGVNIEVRDNTGRVLGTDSGQELNTAFLHLPVEVFQSLKAINDRIETLVQSKEVMVAKQNFEAAARLRDKVELIKRQLLDAVKTLQTLIPESENDSK